MLLRILPACLISALSVFIAPMPVHAQADSVDVTFRYVPSGNPGTVHVPGEFNSWANNSSGSIVPNPRWTMIRHADGSWEKTIRLRVGGGSGPGGSYEYKYNENGSPNGWLSDPRNPRTSGSFSNSIVFVQRPTLFHIWPLPDAVSPTDTVRVTARVFAAVGAEVDPDASRVLVNGIEHARFAGAWDPASQTLSVVLGPLPDGTHTIVIDAAERGGARASDSTRIIVRAAPLQWLSRSNPRVRDSAVTVTGMIASSGVENIRVRRLGTGDEFTTSVTGDRFTARIPLVEGENVLRAVGIRGGNPTLSDTITLRRLVDHRPRAVIQSGTSINGIDLTAFASTDPDGDALTFTWTSDDARNPAPLGISRQGAVCSFPIPIIPGEYHLRLEAKDPAGNTDIARTYLSVDADGTVRAAAVNGNPVWVRDAIVYEIFVPAFTPGTLAGVTARLRDIADLGVNTLWLMPIMDNAGSINAFNGGYSIIDFRNVDESIGTLDDFRRLRDTCRALGLRVILDITPNHVSAEHPWVRDVARWKDFSIYRGHIENRVLGGDRGLGQSVVSVDGYPLYARYSNWTLPNLNLASADARADMLDVYRFWLEEMDVDGFRMDVYWGPQNRYGAPVWWRPFREEVKRYKPDVFILGETDGTGPGSEINYTDGGGANDAGYDWNWYGQIKTTLSGGDVNGIHNRTTNYASGMLYNMYTGPHAHYFRFMENHDEERIAQLFSSNLARTRAGAALLFTAPGIPMIYAGQEVGWKGQRDRINFQHPDGATLRPWYRRLARLRTEYEGFRSPRIARISAPASVYAYLRPARDRNLICAVNFSNATVPVQLALDTALLERGAPIDPGALYYLNDLLSDSTLAVRGSELTATRFQLGPFQSRAFLLADSAMFPILTGAPAPPSIAGGVELHAAWPQPLRSGIPSVITSTLPESGRWLVTLTLHDALGRQVAVLADAERPGGTVTTMLPDAGTLAAGSYLVRLRARDALSGTDVLRTTRVTVLR